VNWPRVPWDQVSAVASAEVRAADVAARDRFGIEPLQLMEVAAWQLARFVESFVDGVAGKRVIVVAGSGNNGGDALCAARFLAQRGAAVQASIVPARDLGSLAAHHAATLRQLGIPVLEAPQAIDQSADVILDGLLGTGIHPPLRPPAPAIIDAINRSRRPVIAVDVPSGMDADDAGGADTAVQATATVTLAAPKAGLRRASAAGRVFLADIGMPAGLFSTAPARLEAVYRRGDLVELV
jgi:ADP-dependent NAD(P)H-hydrate dehydratase / NAD(P)H-hydrate epimerase